VLLETSLHRLRASERRHKTNYLGNFGCRGIFPSLLKILFNHCSAFLEIYNSILASYVMVIGVKYQIELHQPFEIAQRELLRRFDKKIVSSIVVPMHRRSNAPSQR